MGKSVRLWASAKWRPLVTPQKAWFPREWKPYLISLKFGLMILLGLSLVVFNLYMQCPKNIWDIIGSDSTVPQVQPVLLVDIFGFTLIISGIFS